MNVKPLLDFIAKPESGGDYNVVWGRIKPADRPKRPIVSMTIAEVLAWQESIDARYQSEAAGRYQIMEDTLRPLPAAAGLKMYDLFNEANQDALATVLLRRRGLDKFIAGQISAEEFANNLAREWASLPVVTGPKAGRSFYAGDGLNKSHVSVDEFLAAVRAVKDTPMPTSAPAPALSFWASIFTALAGIWKGR
jgi:muramidase (phage lysozyme)